MAPDDFFSNAIEEKEFPMLLQDRHAVIHAATGAISKGVAREMARHGAKVHLSALRPAELEDFAKDIGAASLSPLDATNTTAVRAHAERIAREHRIDIVFNGIGGRPAGLGYPAKAEETALEDFLIPLNRIVGSQFLTSREAARVMQDGGKILTLSATLSGGCFDYMAGISAACGAVEVLTQSLAAEYAPRQIRVNCVRGSAMPETRTIQETGAGQATLRGAPPSFAVPLLGRPITVEETAKAAVFLASDLSSGMTAQMITVCAGQFPTHV
jgi:3-oxoacyl-[acyl-carrier protein] reductase